MCCDIWEYLHWIILFGLFNANITGSNLLQLKGHLEKNYLQIKPRFLECFLGVGLLLWKTARSSMKTHWDVFKRVFCFSRYRREEDAILLVGCLLPGPERPISFLVFTDLASWRLREVWSQEEKSSFTWRSVTVSVLGVRTSSDKYWRIQLRLLRNLCNGRSPGSQIYRTKLISFLTCILTFCENPMR